MYLATLFTDVIQGFWTFIHSSNSWTNQNPALALAISVLITRVTLHCLVYKQVKVDFTSTSNAVAVLDLAICKFGEEALAKMDGAIHAAIFIIPEQICNSCIHHVYLV